MANEEKKPLTLGRNKLELKKTIETGQVRQSFSHGRSKVVQVERKRKRQFEMSADGSVQEIKNSQSGTLKKASAEVAADAVHRKLSEEEKAYKLKVLQQAKLVEEEERVKQGENKSNTKTKTYVQHTGFTLLFGFHFVDGSPQKLQSTLVLHFRQRLFVNA